MRPVIGITCSYLHNGTFAVEEGIGMENQQWQLLPNDYIAAVEAAGGCPLVIPIHGDTENSLELLERVDGVLLSGGSDVGPLRYGELPSPQLGKVIDKRDRQELAMTRWILERTHLPLLGICRGIQVLNVALGGTLYQDHQESGLDRHSILNMAITEPSHTVEVEAGSLLAEITGPGELEVNSLHHQSVKALGRDLKVTARAPGRVAEAVELPGRDAFTLGVQWHPEALWSGFSPHLALFQRLVAEAGKTRRR